MHFKPLYWEENFANAKAFSLSTCKRNIEDILRTSTDIGLKGFNAQVLIESPILLLGAIDQCLSRTRKAAFVFAEYESISQSSFKFVQNEWNSLMENEKRSEYQIFLFFNKWTYLPFKLKKNPKKQILLMRVLMRVCKISKIESLLIVPIEFFLKRTEFNGKLMWYLIDLDSLWTLSTYLDLSFEIFALVFKNNF